MSRKALRKDFYMEIRKSRGRFLSILFIVAIGVAFFSGIRATEPDMVYSGDAYFDKNNMMDIQVISTLGLTEDDIEALESVDGIESVEAGYSTDALCTVQDSQSVVHIMSILSTMNTLQVEEGRLPQTADECAVDANFLTGSGYEIGDTITFTSGTEDALTESLETDTFTIVGTVSSPCYISFSRGSTTIGTGTIEGFISVLPESFSMDVYTELYAFVEGAKDLTAFTDAYTERVDEVMENVEAIREDRETARYDEIVNDAQAEIDDAKQELADAKAEAEEELADAKSQIDDGNAQLEDAKEEIAASKVELQNSKAQLEASQTEVDDSKVQLNATQAEVDSSKAQLEASQAELDITKEQLNASQAEVDSSKAQLEASQAELDSTREQLDTSQAELDQKTAELASQAEVCSQKQTELESSKAEYQSLKEQYEAAAAAGYTDEATEQMLQEMEAQIAAGEAELAAAQEAIEAAQTELAAAQAQIDAGQAQVEEGQAQIDAGWVQVNEGQAQIDAGWVQVNEGQAQIDAARTQIEEGQAQINAGWTQVNEGQAQIDAGWIQVNEGQAQIEEAEAEIAENAQTLADAQTEYEEARQEAEEQIADGEAEIADAEEEVASISMAKWYINDRDDMTEYTGYGENADRMRAIGEVFPVIFFLVAALISLTTMTRMVEEQRTQIGTLKALGYERHAIAAKHIGYALLATVAGSLIGVLIGEKIFPAIIITAYGIMYPYMKELVIPYNMQYALAASLAALACTLLATIFSCYKELREQSAELMRPPTPKQGKRVFLEKLPFLWKHFNFTWKATIRNLLRYKKRFFMTIFGIGGCMGLLLVGFGLKDSIFDIGRIQYHEIQLFDGTLVLNDDASEEEKASTCEELEDDSRVEASVTNLLEQVTVGKGDETGTVYLNVPEETDNFSTFVVLRNRTSGESCTLDDEGVILSEKMAKELNAEVGDTIYIEDETRGNLEVTVSGICENYMQHYLYMTPTLYEKLYGEEPAYNAVYFIMSEEYEDDAESVGEEILTGEGALSISYTADVEAQLDDMLGALNIVIVVLVISAGMLAFVVLYNLNNINITERKRELATLKVLGFYPKEVAEYVYRENSILTVIGALVGMVIGKLLHRFIIVTVEIPSAMFGRNINWDSFVYGFLITIAFALFVNGVMYFRLKKIDMVESLKSVE